MANNDRTNKADPLGEERMEKAAFDYLGRYMASAETLRRVLVRRVMRWSSSGAIDDAHTRAVIEQTIAKCLALDLVDDQRFADASAASLARRGASIHAILAKLGQKGIDRQTAKTAVDRLAAETDGSPALTSAARLAERRRLGPYRIRDRVQFHDKDLAAMARAGHSLETARTVIDAETPDDLKVAIEESDDSA